MEKHNLNFDILDTSPISKSGNMGYSVWSKRKKKDAWSLGSTKDFTLPIMYLSNAPIPVHFLSLL
jgi:hypothetical protein